MGGAYNLYLEQAEDIIWHLIHPDMRDEAEKQLEELAARKSKNNSSRLCAGPEVVRGVRTAFLEIHRKHKEREKRRTEWLEGLCRSTLEEARKEDNRRGEDPEEDEEAQKQEPMDPMKNLQELEASSSKTAEAKAKAASDNSGFVYQPSRRPALAKRLKRPSVAKFKDQAADQVMQPAVNERMDVEKLRRAAEACGYDGEM